MFRHEIRATLVGLTTDDRDPLVTLRDGSGGERLLIQREQSGGDRWDYPAVATKLVESPELEIAANGRTARIPLFPAGLTVLAEQGSVTGIPTPVVAVVDGVSLGETLDSLGAALPPESG
ncbi:MAG: hypothetical protein NVSMB53_12750 [Gemmatimonadaceae bacterium]